MPLTSGTKLGPYEIQSSLGAGGMGEVYRARDVRLDRTVAVKILPAALAADPDRLHRFQYEARVLSTLNHPNVLAIYDVGEQNDVHFLVSEFLEGQSLRETLAAGTLPRRRLVEYALEIAKGLAAAHEKGVVHRDLKPENIFVTRDDRIKILDFGLAKQAPADRDEEQGVTLSSATPTAPGTVMGTVGYMSPEQVRGQVLDHRSDIFSFGAVLYEMASGKRAFCGDSSVETMNAILKDDVPELSVSGTQISPGLERIVRRCLEKKQERRFQSASDLAFALESLSGGSSTQAVSAQRPVAGRKRSSLIIAGLVALALVATGAWLYTRPHSFSGRFTQITFRSAYIRTARFAAGRSVVYGAMINAQPIEIFSTRTDTLESQPLNLQADLLSVSTDGEMALSLQRSFDPIWVPSGRLAKAPLGGGATRELLDDVTDADWNPAGSEVAVSRHVHGRFRLEYPPGKVLYETSGYISDLRFAPSGSLIAFMDHPLYGDDRGYVSVVDLQGQRKVLAGEFVSEQGLAWSAKGDEIWFTATEGSELNALRAVNLRGRSRLVLAAPVRLHLQDISPDGRVLLTSELMRWQIGVIDSKTGQRRDLTAFQWPEIEAISRDSGLILLNSFDITADANYRLYVQRTDGSSPVQVGEGSGAGFSADGKWVVAIDPAHQERLSVIPTGVGEARTLQAPPGLHYLGAAFLPNNHQLLISLVGSGKSRQSALQDLDSGQVRQVGSEGRYVPTAVTLMAPGPSPDGKYCILTDGEDHYWLQALEGSSAREIHGVEPGERLLEWHDDSNNVFVSRKDGADADIYTLNLTTGQRKLWTHFSPADKTAAVRNNWLIITPDGSHYGYMVQRIYSTLFLADGLR